MEKVSVVIPTYNRASLVTEVMDSVRAQTYRPIECVVVDDGSTDETAEAVADWKEVYEIDQLSVRLLWQQNQGVQAARNHGMKEVSGDFLLFLDSDDLLTPRAIERLHQCLVESEVDVAYGDALLVREGSVKERKVQRPPSSSHVISMLNAAPLTSSALIKEEAIDGVRWRESLKRAHEFAFYLDLSLNGATFSYVEYDVLKDRDNAKERITDGDGGSSTIVGIGKVLTDTETEKDFRKMGISENRAYDRSLIYVANLLCRQGQLELSKDLFDKAKRVRVWKSLLRNWNPHIFLTLSTSPKWGSKMYSILRAAKPG